MEFRNYKKRISFKISDKGIFSDKAPDFLIMLHVLCGKFWAIGLQGGCYPVFLLTSFS